MTAETVTVDGVQYVRAYPVATGRCTACGQEPPIWSVANILQAARDWTAWKGHTPRCRDWRSGRADTEPPRPVEETVYRVFGAWLPMLRLAGLVPMPSGAPRIWTNERIEESLLDWRTEFGSWPKTTDWLRATPLHPHYRQVSQRFGSWAAAIESARGVAGGQRRLFNSGPVVEAMRDYLGTTTPLTTVAELLEIDEAPLRRLLRGERPRIAHASADEILTAIGRTDVMASLEAA